MVKTTADLKVGSLKGKIHFATAALAFAIAVCGFAAYFINLLIGNSLYATLAPFFFLALAVIFFGRWLAAATLAPLGKVSLLAKSFERGVSTSLPKTSGSVETDELFESILRLNYQIQKLTASMEQVAAGNLDVALSADTTSDRIVQAFQKLLARASESIQAKQDLENLQMAVRGLSEDISDVKFGNLETTINSQSAETQEIAEALRYLLWQLNEIALQTRTGGTSTREIALEAEKTLQSVIRQNENRVQEMTQACVTLKQVPNLVQKILAEISQSSASANQSIERAQSGTESARKNLNAVGNLRRLVREAIKHIQSLNERSQQISKIAAAIDDLAQRTTMVALNASVQANELGEAGRGLVVVAEEIERITRRAVDANKHTCSLYQTIQAEISQAEAALNATVQETANLSKFAIEIGNVLDEMEKHVAGFLNLQNKIAAYSGERAEETERAFQVFTRGISETENSLFALKETGGSIAKISAAIEDLRSLAADFKISTAAETNIARGCPVFQPTEENIPV